MDRPTITIDGRKIELPEAKARIWREIIKFDETRKEIPTADFVDRHAEIIALAFGVTADEVLDNLEVGEILPVYLSVLTALLEMLTAKMSGKKTEAEPQP